MTLGSKFREMDLVKEMTVSTFVAALFGSLGGIGFGVDYGFWSGMLGMAQFRKDFGVYNPAIDAYAIPSTWQSVGSGPPTAGLAAGCLLSGYVGNRLGRLNTFRLASIISIAGVIIEASSISSYWQIVCGRIIVGLSLGVLANVTPVYLAEVAPLSIRGTLVNGYQFSVGVGAVLVNTANWGMHDRTDQWAYRLSIMLQFLAPVMILPLSFFVPESPRWLIGKGRIEDAIKALVHLRTNTSRDVLEQETQLIEAQENENKQSFGGSWAECFKGTNRRRTLIVTGVQCLQQAQGSSFMSTYAVLFFQTLGIKDEYRIIVLLLFVQTIASAFAFYIPDRFGRRWILISMALVMGLCMLVVSIVMGFSFANNAQGLSGATACVFIWQFATSIGWSSCVWIVTAEVPSLQLREKTITIGTFSGFSISILITFISPFIQDQGYGNLGARIGFLWGGFSVIAALWTYFYLPETGFRSLEELDQLFFEAVPVREFTRYQAGGFGAQLSAVEHGQDCKTIEGRVVEVLGEIDGKTSKKGAD